MLSKLETRSESFYSSLVSALLTNVFSIAKRIIASEITPALSRWISQHPGVAIAREDE